MSRKILTDLDLSNISRILNLPDPATAQEPATRAYVDSMVEGLAWKDSARVATQSNINLASPGATIDSITMVSGDRVLVSAQTTSSENGIYIYNGAATPMVRAADASTSAELEQAVITIEEGSSAGATYRQTAINFTLGSGSITWASFGSSVPSASTSTSGTVTLATQTEVNTGTDPNKVVTPQTLTGWVSAPKRYATDVGDGSSTQYTITHNLGSRDVIVDVYRGTTPWDTVICEVEKTTINSLTLRFASAPTSNQYRVTVLA